MVERVMMDKKDMSVLRVADKYVSELREKQYPDLWRAYWQIEGKILQQKKGK